MPGVVARGAGEGAQQPGDGGVRQADRRGPDRGRLGELPDRRGSGHRSEVDRVAGPGRERPVAEALQRDEEGIVFPVQLHGQIDRQGEGQVGGDEAQDAGLRRFDLHAPERGEGGFAGDDFGQAGDRGFEVAGPDLDEGVFHNRNRVVVGF